MFKFTFTSVVISAADPYTQHQKIWEIFSASSKVLYRIDDDIITVCTDKPPVVEITCKSSIVSTRQLGERINFRLRANVSRRDSKKNGKRVGILDFGEISVWLNAHARKNGFRIRSISEVSDPYGVRVPKPEFPITYNVVDFSGVIEIIDRELFQNACEKGIGPGKGFGLGLLDIAA